MPNIASISVLNKSWEEYCKDFVEKHGRSPNPEVWNKLCSIYGVEDKRVEVKKDNKDA